MIAQQEITALKLLQKSDSCMLLHLIRIKRNITYSIQQ